MALTRMQQRRGSSSQWASENPILAAGEIGFETNNNRFKIGDGLTAWNSLQYFSNAEDVNSAIEAAVSALIDLAPETLDTLNEIAAAINDDPNFFTNVVSKSGDTMTGDLTLPNDPTENLHAATKQYVDQAEADANTYTDTEISTLISDGLAITPGGTEGQVLAKASDTDYDTEWVTPTGFLGDLADVETYEAIDKDTLVYDGDLGLWLPGPGGGRFTVSETAPLEPLNGDTWMDSITGNSYLYYEDGDTNQWIQIAGPGTVGTRGASLFIGTVAPINPVEGDLWYDSEEGFTYLYYVDADSSQWVQFGLNRLAPAGTDGTNGIDGIDGEDGIGIPAGGFQGQVLAKVSPSDYEADWVNLTSISNFVEKDLQSGQFFFFGGERNTATPTVGQRYAFGNGATAASLTMPYEGKVRRLAVWVGPSATGEIAVRMVRNGTLESIAYELVKSGAGSKVATFSIPLSFNANDSISVEITSVSGTLDISTVSVAGSWD